MTGHMSAEEFRRHGKEVIDWIADYMARIETYPVRSQVSPGEIRHKLAEHPPEKGEPFADLMADLQRVIMPGITHWQHPGFFAYFPSNSTGPAILGDLLSSGIGGQGMLWATGPACTELEMLVVDWLAELLGLPDHFRTDAKGGGVIQDSASSASLVALLAAVHRAREAGARHPTVYLTTETHSSLEKAVRVAGLDADDLRVTSVNPATLAMDPAHLDKLMSEDEEAGKTPAFVCATVGTTSTSAVDPVRAIGELCLRHGAWLHVDAAYAGAAAVCPELRWVNDGVAEYADSYTTNPHKWLLTTFDCSVLWVADRAPLLSALSILPEYLRNAATSSGEVIDYRDWQIPLGRRFRALKLWSVIRWYGAAGLREHIRSGVRMAQEFAEWAEESPGFEVRRPHPFGLVCFRPVWPGLSAEESDRATMELQETLNASGALYLTHTRIHGRATLRIAIGGHATERRHVEDAWRRIRDEYDRVAS